MIKLLQISIVLIIASSIWLINPHYASAQADSSNIIKTTTESPKHWGIGVRFSNPSGITLKKYTGSHALELNIGTLNPWHGSSHYYHKHFGSKDKGYYYDHLEFDSRPLVVQLHYLKHASISPSFPRFTYYYGAGAQVRAGRYYYHYYYYEQPDVKVYKNEHRNFIAAGVDGILGFDYNFKSIPFTIFADINFYMEAFNQPFHTQVRTSSGIRYNF